MLQRCRCFQFVVLLGVLLGISAGISRAQVLYGSLTGNVTDSSQALVPGVTLTLSNPETGQKFTATSDDHGLYAFRNILGGTYTLQATAAGFSAYQTNNVPIAINTVNRVDITPQVGAMTESISVTGAATALQTNTGDVHAEIGAASLEQLPLSGYRNYQSLLDLVPGASPSSMQNSLLGSPDRALSTNVNGAS
jgi:hypothetical protein